MKVTKEDIKKVLNSQPILYFKDKADPTLAKRIGDLQKVLLEILERGLET